MNMETEDREWLAQRYVLGDASLDLPAFEQQMQEDPELALAVSKAVEELGMIEGALSFDDQEHTNTRRDLAEPQPRSQRAWLSAALSLSLALLIAAFALGPALMNSNHSSVSSGGSNAPQGEEDVVSELSVVAENWLVLHETEGEEPTAYPELPTHEMLDIGLDSDNDWMEQATLALFEERDS